MPYRDGFFYYDLDEFVSELRDITEENWSCVKGCSLDDVAVDGSFQVSLPGGKFKVTVTQVSPENS